MFQNRKLRRATSCSEHSDHWSGLRLILGGVLVAISVWPQVALAADQTTIVLATSDTFRERVRVSEGRLPIKKPGWFVELSRRAATQCRANVNFVFMPWSRALKKVESGEIHAAFNSSYKANRAEYGVYPLKDGKLDKSRASKNYAYLAYVRRDSNNETLAEGDKIQGHTIAVERQAAIIPELKKRGANVYETGSFLTMLRMLASHRVDAVVAIEDDFDGVLGQHPDLAQLIIKLQPPIQKKIGYVMFSKIFYQDHRALAECFWSASAQLRDTEWFKAMRATYDQR
jgi:polar amino acid transport system substrate-binding protein